LSAAQIAMADQSLDDILDDALKDFDVQSKDVKASKKKGVAKGQGKDKGGKGETHTPRKETDVFALLYKDMETLLREFEGDDVEGAKARQEQRRNTAEKRVREGEQSSEGGSEENFADEVKRRERQRREEEEEEEIEAEKSTFRSSIRRSLRHLSTASNRASYTVREDPQDAEKVLDDILDEFENLGKDDEFVGAVDGLVELLMGKEFLYQPLRDMNEKYPEWLEKEKDNLSDEDYDKYVRQSHCIREMVRIYDEEKGENKEEIFELLQEMQQCGQPPQELMKELAPGIDFSAGGLPEIPAMSELTVGDKKCTIM